MSRPQYALLACALLSLGAPVLAQNQQSREFEALQTFFDRLVAERHQQLFRGLNTVAQWEPRKRDIRASLERMLWFDLAWPPTPPPAQITHRAGFGDYLLENLVVETAPGLFLTANLYLPRAGKPPYPVVLYQCGHASKSHYARHGAWFASHGIAALVMDNIEMGEVEFTHHGVYSHAWFHWYSRGFSPLAVELWNARRAVDYLAARADIDRNRIGATGRSGGGMTTFFLAALDERIKASAPVSGTLSTKGWVHKRLTAAHCDCQYPVNSHALLYSEVGALVAPRPQLICNADADAGFPMDAVEELAEKVGEVYRLYGAPQALKTAVASGGHSDTEGIRLPVYRFFLKELLGVDAPLGGEGTVEIPPAEQLICYRAGLPVAERLTRIDEQWLPVAAAPPASRESLRATLRAEVFRFFPAEPARLEPEWSEATVRQGRAVRRVSFTSFPGLRVKALLSLPEDSGGARRLPALLVADHRRGIPVWGNEQPLELNQWGDRAVLIVETIDRGSRVLERNLRSFSDDDAVHHMKRQAMVMGTTIESMQVYEILRSIELLRGLAFVDPQAITLAGRYDMAVNALYASLLDGSVARVVMTSPTGSHRYGPHYLGVLRYTDVRQVAELEASRVRLHGERPPELAKLAACDSLPDCLR